MRQCFSALWLDDSGQDLTEYSLILALFVMGAFALAGTGQGAIKSIWEKVHSRLAAGVSSANGGT